MQLVISLVLSLTVPIFSEAQIFSEGIRFFDSERSPVKQEEVKKEKVKSFNWKSQLDPETDEFFREGDYIPPAAFLEVMRRPTKENILMFEKWQEKRNLLLSRYEAQRALYLGRGGIELPKIVDPSVVDERFLQQFRFVFYFDANCSSCQAMFQTVNQMVQRGIYVEAVRLDNSASTVNGLTIPWGTVSPSELKKGNFKAVPVLMAFDEKVKKAYQLTGKKTIQEVARALKSAAAS